MTIREPQWLDKSEIDRIYNQYYSNNEYPDFFTAKEHNKFQCSFVVTDDDSDKIILAGGVKTIAEAVVVTDKSLPTRVRLDGLLQALGSTIFISQGMKYRQMHVFVNNDEKYVKVLQRFGFKLMDAKLLILDFGEPNGKAKTA